MERLTGLDAAFLYLETTNTHMHVAMAGVYDVSTMKGGYSFEKVRDHIASRLHLVPPFTRRLVAVPFNLHHPVWVEDPNFNLDYHVRRIGCPAPGGRREFAEITAQIASIPLDRTCPLWEAWVIEGLKHDRIGLVVKVHHSAVDGATGAEIMTRLYDLDPEGQDIQPEERVPEKIPSDQELLTYAALSKLKRARDSMGLLRRTAGSIEKLLRASRDRGQRHGAVPLSAPTTRLNHTIGPRRNVAFARIPLDKAKRAKDVLEVKLNDIVLAVCAGTLRRYLEIHNDLPDQPLIAMCPISVRTEDGTDEGGNRVSGMWASLATDVDDPGERLRMIAASTLGAKSDHDRIGAHSLTDWAEWSAPRTFGLAARLYSSMHVADNLGPIHNALISNVPGPPFPLYLRGAELVAVYPMGPIMDGCALNITVLSYREHIDIGFLVDADLVPDPWELAAQVEPAFQEILKLGEVLDPTLTKSAAPVTATSKSEKARSSNGDGSAPARGKVASPPGTAKTRPPGPAKTKQLKTSGKRKVDNKAAGAKAKT